MEFKEYLSRHLCRTRKVTSLRLTEVVVPPYVDIHKDITICCRFDTDGEKLYSVKWYKDELEFFVVPPYVDIHKDITICCRFDTDGEKLYSVKWYKDDSPVRGYPRGHHYLLQVRHRRREALLSQVLQGRVGVLLPNIYNNIYHNVAEVTSLRLTEVIVPPYVDIHKDITICCKFDTDGEKLYSVKWYKDELEFLIVPPYVDIHEDITICCKFDTDGEKLYSVKWYKDEMEFLVPPYVDIHEDITICCKFDTDGEKLYSVKWYKDELEFFRYMPGNTPHTQIFPRPGIVLATFLLVQQHLESDAVTDLSPENWSHETLSDKTSVTLTALSFNTSGTYRCEVSTEAPSFKTVFASNNLTVMVLPTSEPEIVGVQRRYYLGDHINTTCTSAWSHPAPSLSWYINGAKAEPTRLVQYPLVSSHGLFAQSLGLSFLPERRHFQGPYFALELRCRVTIDNLPPWERLVTPRLHVDLTNQKLSMVLSQASCRDSLLSTVTALSAAILATTT
ncbi:hypothetical protein J6590_063890 [Homalodisca vitripennis]|nr:hypothetical protein J6590_063890 [Homalodisca vitripennis]